VNILHLALFCTIFSHSPQKLIANEKKYQNSSSLGTRGVLLPQNDRII
jgi:hypothetical protein